MKSCPSIHRHCIDVSFTTQQCSNLRDIATFRGIQKRGFGRDEIYCECEK